MVELKSAVLREPDGYASYPDCPSPRGRRHVETLMELAARGLRAILVVVAGVTGARGFRPNWRVDPALARLVARAAREGVEVRAVGLDATYTRGVLGVRMYSASLPVDLGAPA